jgi:selenocysteine-specific elongation factor
VNRSPDARGTIQPGDRGFAQFRFETPVIGVGGDRFIIRSYAPQRTIGGGLIVDPFAAKHRAKDLAAAREQLAGLLSGNNQRKVELFTAAAGEHGLKRSDLIARTGWRDAVAEAAITAARTAVSILDVNGDLLGPSVFHELKARVLKDIDATSSGRAAVAWSGERDYSRTTLREYACGSISRGAGAVGNRFRGYC